MVFFSKVRYSLINKEINIIMINFCQGCGRFWNLSIYYLFSLFERVEGGRMRSLDWFLEPWCNSFQTGVTRFSIRMMKFIGIQMWNCKLPYPVESVYLFSLKRKCIVLSNAIVNSNCCKQNQNLGIFGELLALFKMEQKFKDQVHFLV